MELYVLDNLLRRETVVDRYESLIWTERYSASGDFELVIHATDDARRLLVAQKRLALNESYRVMTIESVEDKEDSDGRFLLTVKGPSVEDILDDRTTQWDPSQAKTPWTITDTPANVIRTIFRTLCVTNTANVGDRVPFYTDGNLFPADTIAEPSETIKVEVKIDTVYAVIKDICDSYGLGFRLYRGPDNSQLYFNVYAGNDRTSNQNDLGAVIFSPALDTLSEISQLTAITDYKNVAYVFAPNGMQTLYSPGSENATGFDRRVLNVDASDITLPAGQALTDALIQRGTEALNQAKGTRAIDGQVPETSKFKYGIDYNLGDLVEMRTALGTADTMRVTEQIFVSDSEGERSYPTLAAEGFITSGSWYAIDSNLTWDDAQGTWDDA